MDSTLLIAYVGAVLIMTLSPGPSTMLGSAHGMRYGAKGTLPTIAGDLTANTLQMLAAAVGLAAIITRSATAFMFIKWAGVAYVAWTGLSHLLRANAAVGDNDAGTVRSPLTRYVQGFVTSASNPKAIVFFAALFPQFIDNGAGAMSVPLQFLILGAIFITLDGLSVFGYSATAGQLSAWLSRKGRIRTQRRITGSALLGAAVLLSLKGAPATDG
jgi:threonine/homoserine/homoserine lactone efflux protein